MKNKYAKGIPPNIHTVATAKEDAECPEGNEYPIGFFI